MELFFEPGRVFAIPFLEIFKVVIKPISLGFWVVIPPVKHFLAAAIIVHWVVFHHALATVLSGYPAPCLAKDRHLEFVGAVYNISAGYTEVVGKYLPSLCWIVRSNVFIFFGSPGNPGH